jgi:hypothetical protein
LLHTPYTHHRADPFTRLGSGHNQTRQAAAAAKVDLANADANNGVDKRGCGWNDAPSIGPPSRSNRQAQTAPDSRDLATDPSEGLRSELAILRAAGIDPARRRVASY